MTFEEVVRGCADLMARYEQTSQLSHLNQIIELCERAPEPFHPHILNDLGMGLWRRYRHTGADTDLERAIAVWEEAQERHRHGSVSALLFTNLGSGYLDRFRRHGKFADLNAGIDASRQALRLVAPDASDRVTPLHNLGSLLMERFDKKGQSGDLREGVEALREAVVAAPFDAPETPMFLMDAGVALSKYYEISGDEEHIELAVEMCEQGVTLTQQDSPNRSRHLSNLANVLARRVRGSSHPDRADLDRAISLLEEALGADLSQTPERLLILGNLAEMTRRRWMITRSDDDLSRGSALFAAATRESVDVAPGESLRSALNWGYWAFNREAWSDVMEAHRFVQDARERLTVIQGDRSEKSAWLARGQSFISRAAYSCAKLRDPRKAVVVLESGRIRLLAESLARDRAQLGLLRPPTLSEIEETLAAQPNDSAVVYLLTTPHGSLGLIASPDEIEPVWATLDTGALEPILVRKVGDRVVGGFLPGQFEHPQMLAPALDELLPKLEAALIAPIEPRLRERGIRRVVLVPTGRLVLLPLHAVFHNDFVVSYAPALRALAMAQRKAPHHPDTPRLFAVANPLPNPKPLPGTVAEVEAIKPWFEASSQLVLVGTEVTRQRVLDAIGEATHLHFACHGCFDPRDSLASHLVLGGGETLTLRDLLDRRAWPRRARLVVLSACQTALSDFDLPEEVIGMPAGFLEAGTPGVVGTLWSVSDLSSALVMIKFYELLFGNPPLHPAEALSAAQRWLRDAPAEEIGAVRAQHPALNETAGAGECFRHPYHWAPFVYVGA